MSRKHSPLVPRDPHAVRAVQERRRSGAAGAHDSTPNRQRTRQTRIRAAVDDQED